jgi:inorganic triphosphatase YgiF
MEIEFKFCIPADRLKAVEAALKRGAVVRTRLQARYFDTGDLRLAADGMVLRLRKEGRRWVQTVKATGDNALHRLEHNVDLGTAAAVPAIDPQRHQGTPVGDRLAKLLVDGDGAVPLLERQSTDIVRLTRDVRVTGLGGAVVEMALDVGKVVAHAGTPEQRESPVCELELELKHGDVQGLVTLARRWSQQHGLWFSTVSKAERGARLLTAQDTVEAVKAEPPRFGSAHPDGRAIQQAVVASCLAQMLPNASEIAAGSTDEEQVHQLRIGIRRLRTALRELAGLDEAPGLFDAAEWEPPLVAAFRALGELRDREQVVKLAQPQLGEAGAPEFDPLAGDEAGNAPSPGDVVRAAAFQNVLVSLIGFTAAGPAKAAPPGDGEEAPSAPAPLDADAARRLLRERLQHLHKQTVRDGQRFESLDTESQHRVRKRLKRLRYLAEFVAPLFDAADKNAAERYLKALRPAQDALGTFNDEAVALALYREATTRDARAWFAVGWFTARHAAGAKACAKALAKIDGASRFWKKK